MNFCKNIPKPSKRKLILLYRAQPWAGKHTGTDNVVEQTHPMAARPHRLDAPRPIGDVDFTFLC